MAKNNKLINSMLQVARRNRAEHIAQASEDVTPKLYASIALVLHRNYGWGHKRINDLFNASQEMWNEVGWEMVEQCYNETGILLETPEQAERNGDL